MEDFSGSDDQMIVKGKRTKRLRPSSSTSSNGGAGELYNSLQVSSPTTSSGISTATEEDEDMANCLILLAQGNSTAAAKSRFSSRKFTEMAVATDGKVGIYVYECKTCNRTFPSFQALGGHRASHKKPRTADDDAQKKSPPQPPGNPVEEERQFPPPSSTQKNWQNDENKSKIHECSICGSEFASGQALGGHMRRHRPAAGDGARTGTSTEKETSSHEKPRSVFALDLNLPAPAEDEKFGQPPRHVFSAAALVDCQY